jgi:hypothetical protein
MNPIRSFWHRRVGSGQLTSGPFYALFPTTKNTRTGIYSHGNGNGRNFSVLATLNTEGVKRAPEVWNWAAMAGDGTTGLVPTLGCIRHCSPSHGRPAWRGR